jgi:hypothetical protein
LYAKFGRNAKNARENAKKGVVLSPFAGAYPVIKKFAEK